ncbi:hypothetical protein [Terrabacter sp. MAHUQ-38]|uniref:hypothetical protein n=1 Tax=unclassified Terrabacter TaxID=2630222 RepID=UPI00165D89B0|nr:hypothetical protein [Terrabacter sp. MAHUQ-38]MBC9821192.1 hypothetical protein [Terrabacter sp. MAHUQ-38]
MKWAPRTCSAVGGDGGRFVEGARTIRCHNEPHGSPSSGDEYLAGISARRLEGRVDPGSSLQRPQGSLEDGGIRFGTVVRLQPFRQHLYEAHRHTELARQTYRLECDLMGRPVNAEAGHDL